MRGGQDTTNEGTRQGEALVRSSLLIVVSSPLKLTMVTQPASGSKETIAFASANFNYALL